MFQEPEQQFVAGRVDEELATGPRHAGRSEADARRVAAELLERLRLGHLAAANPFTLSGGEKRRLSVATALATSPRVLLLDEPTFGQDRLGHEEIVRLVASYRDGGAAICAATHDALLVRAVADRVVEMAAGRTAA